jgi:transaldolase
LIRELVADGVTVNIKAILAVEQVRGVSRVLAPDVNAIVCVFAGRIADTRLRSSGHNARKHGGAGVLNIAQPMSPAATSSLCSSACEVWIFKRCLCTVRMLAKTGRCRFSSADQLRTVIGAPRGRI